MLEPETEGLATWSGGRLVLDWWRNQCHFSSDPRLLLQEGREGQAATDHHNTTEAYRDNIIISHSSWTMSREGLDFSVGHGDILLRSLRSFGHFISFPNISSPSLSFFPSFFLSLSLSLSLFSDFLDAFESSRRHLSLPQQAFLHIFATNLSSARGVISVQSHSSFAGPSPPPDWHISGAAVEALVPMVQSSSPQTPFSLLGKARKVQKA